MKSVILSCGAQSEFTFDILSYPAASYMLDKFCNEGDSVSAPSSFCDLDKRAQAYEDLNILKNELSGNTKAVLFMGAFPLVSKKTADELCSHERAALVKGNTVAAVVMPACELTENPDISDFTKVELPDGEWLHADTAENVYAAQETLRRRINLAFLKKGIFMVDPNSTHISPRAKIGANTKLLPGCLIYGETEIGENCVIGPNSMLRDAKIGNGTNVNASQVNESSVGENTKVGPFAYIRPNCKIGSDCRIGDFVELKNSNIGDGTKVSHLTYIGDSDFGEKINVGCGVVTVNYDGKNKYRTTVEDNAFVGCNVNLVAPVTVERGAFIAAGSTITKTVPADSLSVARERQTNIENWAKKRREAGKLK